MKNFIIVLFIVIWLSLGVTGSLKSWLNSDLDLKVVDIPVVIVLGGILGPFMWIPVALDQISIDDIVLIKAK